MKIKNILFLVLLSIFISACSDNQKLQTSIQQTKNQDANKQPSWFFHTLKFQKANNLENAQCAMQGSAAHINGFAHQKTTAIARAMAELAGYQKSEVDSITEDYMDNIGSNTASSYSVVTVSGQNISASVVDMWIDEKKNYLYVFMCTK